MPSFFLSVSHLGFGVSWSFVYLFFYFLSVLLPYVYIITRLSEKTLKSNLKKTLNPKFFYSEYTLTVPLDESAHPASRTAELIAVSSILFILFLPLFCIL